MSARGRHLQIRRKAVETGKFPCQGEQSRPFPTHIGAWVRIRRKMGGNHPCKADTQVRHYGWDETWQI